MRVERTGAECKVTGRANSDGELRAASTTAGSENAATVLRGHTGAETMHLRALARLGLIRSEHRIFHSFYHNQRIYIWTRAAGTALEPTISYLSIQVLRLPVKQISRSCCGKLMKDIPNFIHSSVSPVGTILDTCVPLH